MHVRRNDMVELMIGESRGTRGRILRAMPRENRVVVEGVNLMWKHVRPGPQYQSGGRVEREAPIDASNVMLLCQDRDCQRYDKPVRTRVLVNPDGTKARVCVKCGKPIVTPQ